MTPASPAPTFRDPAGSLRLEGPYAIRTIHTQSRDEALEFIASTFYQRIAAAGDIVTTTIDDAPDGLRFLHPLIPVRTYPWEWTPTQWLAAADLTLRLCEQALAEGWILKDATPLNILFDGQRPILVDILSFERHQPGISIWLAYGQYIRTFLLPLLALKLLHWPLELSLFRRDGYEPSELYAALSLTQRLSRAAFWPITLPAMLEKRKGDAPPAKPQPKDPGLALHILLKTLKGLRQRTAKIIPSETSSEWATYDSTRSHYTSEQSSTKFDWVRQTLTQHSPQRVLDIGANTGEFSLLAASLGARVAALERDAAAADRLYRKTISQPQSILTIHADLSRPTPAVGWDNNEQSALLPRLETQFDLVLMLAVIHHLILMEQIPIPAILKLIHRLTTRHLILEWVPPTDPMYISLMHGRDDLYGSLSEADLLTAATPLFNTVARLPLENGRVLFLFEALQHEASA